MMTARRRAARCLATHGVLVCSHQRPNGLLSCLAALTRQERRPDDVTVVVRESDSATLRALRTRPADSLPLRVLTVGAPGKVFAQNAALDACRTDILTIADDDTIAPPDWLERIFNHFAADPTLGGLGGRDRCHCGETVEDGQHSVVGRLQWFGRTIGNHHIGFGDPRKVDFLKGANMSYRAEAFADVRFDLRLRGQRAQPHDDLAFLLAVRRAGWALAYNPAVLVAHYATLRDEPRYYVRGSQLTDQACYFDNAYNHAVAVWDTLSPMRRVMYAAWVLLVGMTVLPGLAQAMRLSPGEGLSAWRRFLICQRAHFAAYASLLRGSALPLGTAKRTKVVL